MKLSNKTYLEKIKEWRKLGRELEADPRFTDRPHWSMEPGLLVPVIFFLVLLILYNWTPSLFGNNFN